MSPKAPKTPTEAAPNNIPPHVPTELKALDRAITLLGERTKIELRQKKQLELIELLGEYPNAKTATAWKALLKQVRTDDVWEREKEKPSA